jgi:uncharacterized protein
MPSSLLDAVVLFFLLGLVAGLLRAELRLPPAIYEFLSVLLLLAIGLKGGVELYNQSLVALLPQMAAVVFMGFALPLAIYPVLRHAGGFDRANSASVAAHYGSVSVGTYAVAIAYLTSRGISFESHIPVFLVLLEMPAIGVGILLARGVNRSTRWGPMAREVLLGKSIVLLFGGLLVGWAVGPDGIKPIKALFFDLFKGALALFLLEMGLIAASQIGGLRRHGLFLIAFGFIMPIVGGTLGAGLGWLLGLSVGGTVLLATLVGSASYIAAPAAMRLAVPEANPALSLAASLGVTFPFNVVLGIPLYHRIAEQFHRMGA